MGGAGFPRPGVSTFVRYSCLPRKSGVWKAVVTSSDGHGYHGDVGSGSAGFGGLLCVFQ